MRALFLTALLLAMTGCTENQRTKSWGGTMTVDLACGEMLYDLTWKGDNFWYATQPMPEGYVPRTTKFHEKADGARFIGGGTVIIKECK